MFLLPLQVLAVAGSQQTPDGNQIWMIQFYNQIGEHTRTLRVPGTGMTDISWEGNGLRLAMAVDSFIYFASVRQDYMWGYFKSTLVYAFMKPERPEHCVMFWDTSSNDRYAKYVRKLVGVQAQGDYCVLSTKVSQGYHYDVVTATLHESHCTATAEIAVQQAGDGKLTYQIGCAHLL